MSGDKPSLSFDQFVKQGRKKKQAENLAQKLLGSKGRRSSAPPVGPKAPGFGGNLASRVGVNKRNNSLPRATTPRGPRPAAPLTRLRSDVIDRPSRPSSTRPEVGSRSNSTFANGSSGLSIRGAAASAPLVVIAQNFAPGTTAADIESVMDKVGGALTSCRLIASTPTVIAEMEFADNAGAEEVITQFNGKKADGRTLYVYRRDDGGARRPTSTVTNNIPFTPASAQPAPLAATTAPDPLPIQEEDDVMMLDDATSSAREANNLAREQRRGRDERDARDAFPTGPRGYGREEYYDRGPRPGYGGYRDGYGRDGYGSRGGYGGGRYDGRDNRGYGGGRNWRP